VVSLACTKPKELGLAAELWTISALAFYVREHAQAADHPSLSHASKSTVWRILNAHEIKPHRVRYYLERRDEQFEDKMREVLMVYREISMDLEEVTPEGARPIYTISVDEKPGVQALATSAPDLPPVPGRHAGVGRDHDYVRHGTVSILAGVDLHDGHIIAQIHDRHRSREFVELLKEIDAYYPPDSVIRVILDNHSAHISKETMRYLATRPGRFVYVHTPKHGSWLNLIEAVFSKMSRTFLRHIRVSSKAELVERIMTGVAEFNQHPVVFRWRNFDKLDTET
jgi:transposase